MHGSALLSSLAVLNCASGMHQLQQPMGLCPWSRNLQDPCSKSLLCSQTTPWNKLFVVFPLVCLCSDLSHCTMSLLSLHVHSPAMASRSHPWKPWSLLWLQQRGHKRSRKRSYSLRADTRFPDIRLPKAHKHLLLSPISYSSKAKGIQTD